MNANISNITTRQIAGYQRLAIGNVIVTALTMGLSHSVRWPFLAQR